jgi:hypothetical protein
LRGWSALQDYSDQYCLPPLEFCRRTRPIHAARLGPDLNIAGSGTDATKALARTGPTPLDTHESLSDVDGSRLADRFRIGRVVLLTLCIRLNISSAASAGHRDPLAQFPGPIMRGGARLNFPTKHGASLAKNATSRAGVKRRRRTTSPAASMLCTGNTDLAIIQSDCRDPFHGFPPFLAAERSATVAGEPSTAS